MTDLSEQPSAVAEPKNYKALQATFESYESTFKSERNFDYDRVIKCISGEIDDILSGKNQDVQHIVLFGLNFLPKYFKLLLARKYTSIDLPQQYLANEFINNWLRRRVPLLGQLIYDYYHLQPHEIKDPFVRVYGIQKEFEILELIFDDRNEIYNTYVIRNSQEIQERLARVFDNLINMDIDQQQNQNANFGDKEVAVVGQSKSNSPFYVHNINVFSFYQGFDQIMNLFTAFDSGESSSTQSKLGARKPVLKVISLVLSMLINIKYYLKENFWSGYIEQLKQLLHQAIINQSSPDDLRSLTKKETTYLIGSVESILDWNRNLKLEEKLEQAYRYSDQIELHIAKICLQMPVLEKKIIGHNLIGNKISKIKSAIHFAAYSNPNVQNIHLRWINTERLVDWINENQIFDLIFGDSLHSEVIKKSVPLLEFMYDNNCIREREIDKMWDCVTKKHEAYKVAILRALSIITSRANLKDIKYIFKKVRSLQLSEVDKFTLNLVKSVAKRISGEESRSNFSANNAGSRQQQALQNGRGSGMGRSNSVTKETEGRGRAEQFRKEVMRSRNSNSRLDELIQQDSQKKRLIKDDIDVEMISPNKGQVKKTRSLSGKEDLKIDVQKSNLGKNAAAIQPKLMIEEEKKEPAPQRTQQSQVQRPQQTHITQRDEVENPLEVPADKEDKNTADDDGSFGERDEFNPNENGGNFMDEISDNQNSNSRFEQNAQVRGGAGAGAGGVQENAQNEDEEVKGQDGEESKQEQNRLTIRLMITDDTLGIEEVEKRQLAQQVLEYLFHLCLEETVLQHNISLQIHKLGIETFVEILSQNYTKALLPYISKCITYLQHNFSVISLQTLIQKLIVKIPLSFERGKQIAKNRQELIKYIDDELSIANFCLNSYIEFKRISLQRILEQFGSQEQEQENLETQSSLDNEDEKTSQHSAQKQNAPATQNQSHNAANISIQDHSSQSRDQLISVQDDHTNQSSGSLFISPRGGRQEEEFKVPISHKTQSYQGDMLIQAQPQYPRNNDFSSLASRDQDSGDDWFQKNQMQNPALGTNGSQTVGNRHFNSQRKPNQQNNRVTDMTPGTQVSQAQRETAPEQPQPNQPQANTSRDFLNTLITNEVYHFSYYQDMQHRLEFLKFYFGSSPQILKPQQIQIVWECLVINAFYEKERDQFFNWCTQILKLALSLPGARDIDNIGGASIFKDDCLEMLFFDTLLKLDFRFITETMYECFERFMIYINEQYGQIITNTTFESNFEVFDTKLIGSEALWEITLCARNEKVYQKSTDFLHKLYKKMSPTLKDKLNEIKEDLLQTCMEQIKSGLADIRNEQGQDPYEIPIYQLTESIEDPKNRIARSISQLCKFIDEFEGLRDRGAKTNIATQEKEIYIICSNQINGCNPKKLHLNLPLNTKMGSIREQIASLINPSKQPNQLCIAYKGKFLDEDTQNLKDIGIGAQDTQATFLISLRNEYEMESQINKDEQVDNMIETIKCFGVTLPDEIIRLAVKKSGMNIEEAFCLLTLEDSIIELEEEVSRQKQAENHFAIIEDKKDDGGGEKDEESKLNLKISNRAEYFDILFDLLNLGINEITIASWNLLLQVPVNRNLLNSIRNLSIVQQGYSGNWAQIIDQSNIYKMLYSLQIVNSFISVNNEKLSEAEIQERYEWRERFLELGGFDHLYHIIISLDLDEIFIDSIAQVQRNQAQSSKKKQRALNKGRSGESAIEVKNRGEIQNTTAKCLGYLISIIKIFIQAALLTDSDNLMTIIAQTSTSPFRKPKNIKSALQQIGPQKLNQMFTNEEGGNTSMQDVSMGEGFSRDNSGVNTPKFHSSNSSNIQTPDCPTPGEQQEKGNQNKSIDTIKTQQTFNMAEQQSNDQQLYTIVDDFPRLVEQMNGGYAKNLLDKVINFNALISKLLYIIQKSTQVCDSKEVSSLVQNSLDLLLPCVVWKPNQLLKEIYEFEHLESLLINTLMFSSNENVRRSLEKTFKTICSEKMVRSMQQQVIQGSDELEQKSSSSSQLQIESPKLYILKILLKHMPEINQKSEQCEEYFNLLTSLIKECNQNFHYIPKAQLSRSFSQVSKFSILIDSTSFSSVDLLEWCVSQLKLRPTYEDKYSNYTDKILGGYMQLTQSILEIDPQLKSLTVSEPEGYNLVQTLFESLFLLPSVEEQQRKHREKDDDNHISSNDYPKCKRKFTRKKAFNLLLTLCHQCKPNYVQLLEELYKFHAQIKNFEKIVNMKDIDLDQSARSGTGYVGLMNFAATCYMNSLIQQLFMIPDLRKGILRAPLNDEDLEHNVLHQLKLTFANLQESEKQYYAPSGFTSAFKFYGEPVNVRVQQDTHEFFNVLCENIEDILKDSPAQNVLKETIGGVIANETKSLEAEYPYSGEKEENFFALTLDIKNKKNLAEALDLYIKPDFLEGDNKYMCDKYNTKVNAQRRSFLKKLSNTVIINLKRFDFDYNTLQRQKLNDYCEFPQKINFKPWTKEGIREREKEANRAQRNENGDDVSNQNNPNEDVLMFEEGKGQAESNRENSGEAQNAAGDDIDQEEMNSDEENDQENEYASQGSDQVEEEKKGGEALDEDMDSPDEENDQNVNTGAYFDEDIAVDEDESQNDKKNLTSKKAEKKKNLTLKSNSKRKSNSRKRLQSKDESYYEYELVGVLVHSGGAEGGHYYSYIRERSGQRRWLRFDDKNVTVFDESRLGAECFGGQSSGNNYMDDFGGGAGGFFQRSANAYLLFYQRVQPIQEEKGSQLIKQIDNQIRYINDIQENIYQRIWEENAAFLKLKVFFDQEYFSFIREYIGIYNFENVLYFSQDQAASRRIQELQKMSIDYDKEVETMTASARRNQERVNELEHILKNDPDYNIFSNVDCIREDPGLNALKLATVLSTDIITKANDVQSFVSWMQIINQHFQGHEIACVWFIKYITENNNILEQLLLESQSFEVRDNFSALLKTALSVTAKNEVSYFEKFDDYYEFTKDGSAMRACSSQASTIRFIDLLFNKMLDKVRRHWRRFEEYFFVLLHFTQSGFPEAKFMIESRAIYKLVEFIANSNIPFKSDKFQMGERGQEPDFKLAYDLLSYLVRCCVTDGILNINEYSHMSVYQNDGQHLHMSPEEKQAIVSGHFFKVKDISKQSQHNKAMLEIIQYMSWGDQQASAAYIREILEHFRFFGKSASIESFMNLFEYVSRLLLLKDSLQEKRISEWFQLDGLGLSYAKIFDEMKACRFDNPKLVLHMIKFFGNLALQDDAILAYLSNFSETFREWVIDFLTMIPLRISIQIKEDFLTKREQDLPEIKRAYSMIFSNQTLFESEMPAADQETKDELFNAIFNDSFDAGNNVLPEANQEIADEDEDFGANNLDEAFCGPNSNERGFN